MSGYSAVHLTRYIARQTKPKESIVSGRYTDPSALSAALHQPVCPQRYTDRSALSAALHRPVCSTPTGLLSALHRPVCSPRYTDRSALRAARNREDVRRTSCLPVFVTDTCAETGSLSTIVDVVQQHLHHSRSYFIVQIRRLFRSFPCSSSWNLFVFASAAAAAMFHGNSTVCVRTCKHGSFR